MRKTILSILVLLPFVAAAQTLPVLPSGYTKVWADEFNGTELDENVWTVEVNGDGGGNQELQFYRRQNVAVRDGNLVLTARRENYNNKSFTSGRINSRNKVAFKHGWMQARIKFPKTANGLWPAYWMMGNDYGQAGWPRCGEMDIVELGHANGIKNGTQDRYFMGTLHYGPSASNTDHQSQSHDITVAKDKAICDGNYHVLSVEWDDNKISMYYDLAGTRDDQKKAALYAEFSVTSSTNDFAAGKYFQKEFFFIFNLAVGGQFTGIYNASGITALPKSGDEAEMLVDWVRVYQKKTDENRIYITPDGTNKKEDEGGGGGKLDEDFDTEIGRYASNALDDKGATTFNFDKASDVVIIGTSGGVTDAFVEKTKANYNVDDVRNFLWVWSGTLNPQPCDGVNSFGFDEVYNHYTVGTVGWSGLGYASNSGTGKDMTVIDDDHLLHFAMRGIDPERHASHKIMVGDASFTIGTTPIDNTPILGDFRRDGSWTYFDIPVKVLRALIGGGELFSGSTSNYAGNVFAIVSGGTPGTDLQFDNVFFYKTQDDIPDVPQTDTTTPIGQYAQKSVVDGKPTFDFDNVAEAVLIATSGGVTDALSGVTVANYNVDDQQHFLYNWTNSSYSELPSSGNNSFGWAENYTHMVVSGTSGWNGAGYASTGKGKDLSMIDDTYFIHFALKGNDVLTHASQTITVGNAKFVIGNQTEGLPMLGDYRRDGEWYSFDIPVAKLNQLAGGTLFTNASAYVDNVFAFSTTNVKGYEISLDNVFFYKKKSGGEQGQVPTFVSAALDATGLTTFDFSDVRNAILIGTSQGVTEALSEVTLANYNVDEQQHFFHIWDATYSSAPSTGVNSFGWEESYTNLTVTSVGWSGAGYASSGKGKDLSMIDDTYYLHVAFKATDNAVYRIIVGKAMFAIGDKPFDDNGTLTSALTNFTRDGQWYYLDIPMSEIMQRATTVFPSAGAFLDNVFAINAGGTTGTHVQMDNIFFYQKASEGATAIQHPTADQPATLNGQYNLAGQRVDSNYRGIVVSHGKKVVKL